MCRFRQPSRIDRTVKPTCTPSNHHSLPSASKLLQLLERRSTGDAASLTSLGLQIAGRRILITGAGGSIGSALAQAIASFAPARLILLDSSEHALYQIDRTLNETPHISILGNVCDPMLLAEIFDRYRPQIVFHAAAFKHVPLLELNPFAAIANNVLGTYSLLQTAIQHHAEHLVLISTDKAVDPLSLMGASKRIAELLLLAHAGSSTRLSAVRLVNVLGSQGSVVPLFLDQIAHGGPLTVTHPEATRFFLSIGQSTQAILAALEPRPQGTILVPDLGHPIRIADLARDLIAVHSSSASVVFTQLRPGDKLEETLISARETLLPPAASQILTPILSSAPPASVLHAAMRTLQQAVAARDLAALLRVILKLLPEYTPSAVLLESLQQPLVLQEVQEARA